MTPDLLQRGDGDAQPVGRFGDELDEVADQYVASPLNGHVVWNVVASSRSIRMSAFGR